ncbi:F-box domain-containing protein [Diaporthe helianthi]|uniref:F-box domain-containing protein n=1 Tax=Diaporthe helianthi TaxID=158607 RepID=A0A2P5I3S2_DIAHE|nr:F-box domain-containing protein [Diaporthe helianthi]
MNSLLWGDTGTLVRAAAKPFDQETDELVAANHSAGTSTQRLQTKLMDLPTELHLLITKELTYPDALSLKHTSRYFYNLVDTGVRLKVAWLMERRMLRLDCPNDRKCNLRTDLDFCRGSSVTLLMQRRREHIEYHSRALVHRDGRGPTDIRLALDGGAHDVGSGLRCILMRSSE